LKLETNQQPERKEVTDGQGIKEDPSRQEVTGAWESTDY
jgi:hypothetical protein